MLLLVVGLSLALALAVALVVVRARRRSQRSEITRRADTGDIGARRDEASVERADDEAQRFAAREKALRRAEQIRLAAHQEAQHRAESDRADEASGAAIDQETKRRAEEAHVATEQEAQHQAEGAQGQTEEAAGLRRAEETARGAAELGAESQAELVTAPQKKEPGPIDAQEGLRAATGEETPTTTTRVPAASSGTVADASAVRLGFPALVQVAVPTPAGFSSADHDEPVTPLRPPRQYRPAARVPAARGPAPAGKEPEARDRAMPIEVRLVFERAGFCRVSLLPRRAEGMPQELAVAGSGDPPELVALQDEWYQDVELADIGRVLRGGIEWAGSLPEGRRVRWSLSGREIYVLARHSELSGFVSAPRLTLGGEHVVLCAAERLNEVREAIAMTGSPEPALLDSGSGIPAGWSGLRGVAPRMPVAPSPFGDILDALRPLADVKLVLEGGIRIDRQAWLSGFPPNVRLRGDTSTISAVTIDGRDATISADGDCVVSGWDSPGDHSVWCTSDSRTYAIRDGAEDWEPWDAYTWSLGELRADGMQSRPAICGVLVRPPRAARPDGRARVVPASNPILIGADPGEIAVCSSRSDLRAGVSVGFPWFEPVWAIPADAHHCDKRTARVLLVGPPQPVAKGEPQRRGRSRERRGGRLDRPRNAGADAWCTAILAASGKGLQTEPARPEIVDLWKTYRRCAKALRRSWR